MYNHYRGKVELPLHFRYQAPSPDSPYRTVPILPPMAFIMTNQLPKPLQHNSIQLPCNVSATPHQLCLWTRTQIIHSTEKDGLMLAAEIPQGLEQHRVIVVGLTVFITLVATVYIAYSFMTVRERTESSKKNQ